jgi:hypothetical protein
MTQHSLKEEDDIRTRILKPSTVALVDYFTHNQIFHGRFEVICGRKIQLFHTQLFIFSQGSPIFFTKIDDSSHLRPTYIHISNYTLL